MQAKPRQVSSHSTPGQFNFEPALTRISLHYASRCGPTVLIVLLNEPRSD